MRKVLAVIILLALCLPFAAQAEVLTYTNDHYGVKFDLLEGWTAVEDPNREVFTAPDGNGVLMIFAINLVTDADFFETFEAGDAKSWVEEEEVLEDVSDVEQLLFAKAMGEDGRFYALSMCAFKTAGTSFYYLNYFCSTADQRLGSLALVTPVVEGNSPVVRWFDTVVRQNVPAKVMDVFDASATQPGASAQPAKAGTDTADMQALAEKAKALLDGGEHEQALAKYDELVALAPKNGEYVNDRGVALFYLGRNDEAYDAFSLAVELAPEYVDAYYNLAYLLLQEGKLEEAQAACINGLLQDAKDSDLTVLLGDVQFAMDDFGGALVCYDRAIGQGNYTAKDIPNYAEVKKKAANE